MDVKILFLVIAMLACFNYSVALQCFMCAGSSRSDCAKSKFPSMVVDTCKQPSSHVQPFWKQNYVGVEAEVKVFCLSLSVAEEEYKPNLFMRSCGSFPTSVTDPCDFLRKHAKVKFCKACDKDQCNKRMYDGDDEEPIVNTVV